MSGTYVSHPLFNCQLILNEALGSLDPAQIAPSSRMCPMCSRRWLSAMLIRDSHEKNDILACKLLKETCALCGKKAKLHLSDTPTTFYHHHDLTHAQLHPHRPAVPPCA